MRKIATALGTAALFAAAVLPAVATGNNCGNGTTGPLSTNYCTINNSSDVSVENINDAQISNRVTVTANTGNNSASYNTLGGSVKTGNATLNTTVSNIANWNTTTITGGPAMSSNSGANEITGPSSDNRVTIDNRLKLDVDNSNTASVINEVDTISNSGNNRADFNTGPASVRTGDAAQWTGVLNHVNDNGTAIDAGAGGAGGNNAENNTTGPLSTDYVNINNDARVHVANINDAIIGNFVRTLANTGFNSASFNTLGGDVDTGNAVSGVDVESVANRNTTSVELAMGAFGNNASNDVTGPLSDNQEVINNNQKIDVENLNNKCKSHNADRLGDLHRMYEEGGLVINPDNEKCDVSDLGVFNYNNDVASTGENASDYNTGGGISETGWADLWKSIVTALNDTVTVIKP